MENVVDLRYDSVLENILELLQGKYQDIEYRKIVSRVMRKKIDGKGAQRIAKELCKMKEIQKLNVSATKDGVVQ